jgi:hypothetical protein
MAMGVREVSDESRKPVEPPTAAQTPLSEPAVLVSQNCERCGGTGGSTALGCSRCDGSGRVVSEVPLSEFLQLLGQRQQATFAVSVSQLRGA